MSGWVKIYRKITDKKGYFAEPFCRNMAWVDLLLLANHDDNFFRVRGVRVDVKRGQVGHGLEKLAERWQWSRGKAERFLNELENESQIVRQKNNVTTLISVCNYQLYQDSDNANSKANSKANGQQTVKQTDINKKEKNEKNEKNEKKNTGASAGLFAAGEIVLPWNSKVFIESWERWKGYKEKQYKFKFKSIDSEQAALFDLSKMANGFENIALEIINQSLAKGWKGLFELKTNQNGKSTIEDQRNGLKAEFSRRFGNG